MLISIQIGTQYIGIVDEKSTRNALSGILLPEV